MIERRLLPPRATVHFNAMPGKFAAWLAEEVAAGNYADAKDFENECDNRAKWRPKLTVVRPCDNGTQDEATRG